MTASSCCSAEREDGRPIVLSSRPARPRQDGGKAGFVKGGDDPVVRVDLLLLLLAADEEVAERPEGQVRPLGQEEDGVQGRSDDRPRPRGPDAGGRAEQGVPCALVRPDDQDPRPVRYVRIQVLD